MRWQHKTLRDCVLDVGSGRGAIHIDADGFVHEANEYAMKALTQWAEVIGFTEVPTKPAPQKKRRTRRKDDT
jgi:hypothetical protein